MDTGHIVRNGTYYHVRTAESVIQVLEMVRMDRTRIVIDLGHTEAKPNIRPEDIGKSWGETYDTTGYVGRSTGPQKVPLLIYNSRSSGGGAISTENIVKITTARGGITLYEHPNYQPPTH
jgi:hypothetical protein